MKLKNNILNLDKIKSITNYSNDLDINHMYTAMIHMMNLIKTYGDYVVDINDTIQYTLSVCYLNKIMPFFFEIDYDRKFIHIVYYNMDKSKIFLKIALSINDDPIIKYVHNDNSGLVTNYIDQDHNINLKPGAYLMHCAHAILSFIGFTRVRLDDDSHLIIEFDHNQITAKLWLYLLLTKNQSWYAKFGYEPANLSLYNLALSVSDVKNIKLNEISHCLKKYMTNTTETLDISDNNRITFNNCAKKIINLIGESTNTLYEYTQNHTIYDFAKLTNYLDQSIFTSDKYFWYSLIRKLFVANITQINNNINLCCYRLK